MLQVKRKHRVWKKRDASFSASHKFSSWYQSSVPYNRQMSVLLLSLSLVFFWSIALVGITQGSPPDSKLEKRRARYKPQRLYM